TTNWKVSVTTTPQSPEKIVYPAVMAKRRIAAFQGSILREIWRTVTIARVTQPMMIRLIGSARYRARKPRSAAAGFPPYRSSANSRSVSTPARRQSRAKKKTVRMPEMAPFHHSQFPATPYRATSPATTSGVSAEKVVATMDVPANHQGSARPETKYSVSEEPARRGETRPSPADTTKYARTISPSAKLSRLVPPRSGEKGAGGA